ncbi:MAG: type II toxin-antitoxin system Phd/YefM family antitoxin [Gaiellaceae bacterium MAG52_C11]|nr:type II toxin-antitoxin system Phd/YefM family antitoxin [Candidatus Gaiellasilicea maunaloa]
MTRRPCAPTQPSSGCRTRRRPEAAELALVEAVTIILVMTETLPLSTVKARLSELVDRVEREDDRIVVTRNGRPAAVLVSADDLESLEETLAILSDRKLMRRIREGQREIARGDVISLEELKQEVAERK